MKKGQNSEEKRGGRNEKKRDGDNKINEITILLIKCCYGLLQSLK